MKKTNLMNLIVTSGLILTACSGGSNGTASGAAAEDSSSSGLAAASVGGAIASSSSSGTMASTIEAPSIHSLILSPAIAANTCPRVTTANGSGCTNVSSSVDLTYSACSFGTSLATWSGTLEVSMGTGTVSCGTFPNATGTTLRRQFVSSAGVPGSGSRTSARGVTVTIDHSSNNLSNFDNATITANIGTGYGTSVTFNGSGARTGVNIRQRLYVSGGFDHSIDGNISVSESGGSRTISGSIKVYHNKVKVVGTSTFNNVVYNDTACAPVSGSITTAFAAGVNVSPTVIGNAMVGKSETLTFNGDNTATLVDYSGTSSTVTLSPCF
ncbi:MAG: hypothetical protein ACXWRE_04985 [Pseudobdellovibrionaceae bacterium]